MSNTAVTEPSSARAERMRAAILAAAEDLFASKGFAAARLEDVAEMVQMTRAALFYYYRDKQALYDAMFEDAFGPLRDELERILAASDHSIAQRIEMAANAWIDRLIARPTLARLVLRFVADGPEPHAHGIFSDDDQVAMRFLALFSEGCASGELKPIEDNVFLVASAVVGTTIFYVGALATLVPQDQSTSMEQEQVAGLRREVIKALRHLLGISEKARRRPPRKKTTSTRRKPA